MIRLIILATLMFLSFSAFSQNQKVFVEGEVYVLDGYYEELCMEHDNYLWIDPIFLNTGAMMDSVLWNLDFTYQSPTSGICKIKLTNDSKMFIIELPDTSETLDANAVGLVRAWRNGTLVGERSFVPKFCNASNQLARK